MPNDDASHAPDQKKTPAEIDRAHVPMGEEFDRAKWTLPPIIPVLIAFVVLAVIFGSYAYHQRPGEMAHANIAALKTFPIHTQSARMTGPMGMEGQAETYDQMIVMAHLELKNVNRSKLLDVKSIDAKLTTADGQELTATQSTSDDQQRFFDFYKQLAEFRIDPLSASDTHLRPGQSTTGLVMFSFPLTQDAWQKRKDFAITISLYDQNPIVVHAPAGS